MGNEQSSADVAEAAEALNGGYEEEQQQMMASDASYGTEDGADDTGDDDYENDVGDFFGFRVLGIQEQSPASRVGFVSFFDFIMAANGIRLDTKDSTFMELIAQSEEKPMQLDVFNLKSRTTRQLTLTPSRNWPGKGLLGVTIRFDSYEYAEDQLLHVLYVAKDSPAFTAGLRAGSDYLLGTPERVFRDTDDLQEEILDAIDDHFQSYVYNSEDDQVRIVRIEPSDKWGGGGVLGAEVGHGILHRLPSDCHNTIGTSMGFVSLSEEAKAATDPYLRQVALASTQSLENQSQPAANESEATVGSAVDSMERLQVVEGEQGALEEEERTATIPTGTNDTDVATAATTTETVVPARAPMPVPVAPQGAFKPRYAARIDPRFPMSTVAVLADPVHLG